MNDYRKGAFWDEAMEIVSNIADCVSVLSDAMEAMDKAQKRCREGDFTVGVFLPNGDYDVFPLREVKEVRDEYDVYDEKNILMDGKLLVVCNSDEVVELGENRYLTGALIVMDIDENGNYCSVTRESIRNALMYQEFCITEIQVDGMCIPAFRLEE